MSTNDHAKASDSGYTNTCSNTQSQRGSSSLSRNSNRSESSGYYGGNPSNFGSSNEVLPRPISRKKEKEHKKKKSKGNLTTLEYENVDTVQKCTSQQRETTIYNEASVGTEQVFRKSEIGTVKLMDATDPSEHNGDTKSTIPDGGIGSQTNYLDQTSLNTNEAFHTIVSLNDGLVLYTTASLQTFLGYPKDFWLGKSFIDFVHLKDRPVLADKVSSGFVNGERKKDIQLRKITLFCRLQKYSGENGINGKCDKTLVDDNGASTSQTSGRKNTEAIIYVPFHLNLGFKYFPEHNSNGEELKMLLLTVITQPILSAYKAPEETIISSIFSTRHTATCHLSHVDDDVVRHFGYLPQDMVGQSLFHYYHPEDLPSMKDVYETVVKLNGSSFRSKPYRFAVQNGGYVVLETEWSSFINPWKRKLEFIIGQHRVLRGPLNPDVFQRPENNQFNYLDNINDEVLKESQIIQDEICTLLAEKIPKPLDTLTTDLLTTKPNQVAAFVEHLVNEMSGTEKINNLPSIGAEDDDDDRNFSENNSLMLSHKSPEREYCDSESSSDTPLSYNQLNYNEKIERFFDSKPLGNAVYGSDEEVMNCHATNKNNTQKTSSNNSPIKSITNHDSGGSGSGENFSSTSNNQTSFGSRDDSINGNSNPTAANSFKSLTLTEGLLNKHNLDMEKLMVLKHKERRSSIQNGVISNGTKIEIEDQSIDHNAPIIKTRGTKRSANPIREDEQIKSYKFDDKNGKCPQTDKNPNDINKSNVDESEANINLWPQMAVLPVLPPTAQNPTNSRDPRSSAFTPIMGFYYVPVPPMRQYPQTNSSVQSNNQCQNRRESGLNLYGTHAPSPLGGIIYPPVVGALTPTPVLYAPQMILEVPTTSDNVHRTPIPSPLRRDKTELKKRPASQATSVKAEPGSIMAMSDSSKKPLSPGGRASSCLSIDGDESNFPGVHQSCEVQANNATVESSIEDSSDSSFYGSFLNTSSGSSCNPDPMFLGYLSELKTNFQLQRAARRLPSDHYQKLHRTRNVSKVQPDLKKMKASWMEGIKVTPEFIYQYQMIPKNIEEVLKSDKEILNNLSQPLMVNKQLDQLYMDLELAGFGSKLTIEETSPSSDSDLASSNEGRNTNNSHSSQVRRIRREIKYSKLAMIYEENAPLPKA